MPLPFRAPIFSYEQINELAEEFLQKHALGDKFPIPIDEVIEFKYEIDIVPFPNLQRDFDIDGFISGIYPKFTLMISFSTTAPSDTGSRLPMKLAI